MSDIGGFGDKATIELAVIAKGLQDAIRDFALLGETVDPLDPTYRKIEKSLRSLEGQFGKFSGEAKSGSAAVKAYSKDFEVLLKQLDEFKKKQRGLAQDAVVGGSLDGKNRAEIAAIPRGERDKLLAIDDARAQNAISVIRQVNAAEDKAAADGVRRRNEASKSEQAFIAQKTKDYFAAAKINEELDARAKALADKAANSAIADIKRVSDARTQAYTKALQQAQALDSQIASARDAQRYATVPNARRNTATAGGLAEAQDAYSKQQLAAMGDHYRQLEKTTAAQARNTATTALNTDSIIAQRYALYDVASTYGILGAALIATSGYAVKVGADFESAFTAVERTISDTVLPIGDIRDGLIELSTQIPLTFQELSTIASLGNQLGIASDDVLGFTETIARFSAVSGQSIDQVAESFGKISNLTDLDPSQFENLGSAIAFVARTSESNEATIISTSKEIAAIADGAGFSAEAVVALAGSLSSLAIPPERARGALQIYFSSLNKAVAEGGDDLTNFATIVGVTREQLDAMVRGGEGQKVFEGFLAGLADLDNVSKTQAFESLGLGAVRVDQTFQALSSDIPLVTESFRGASQAFAEGTELTSQYAKVVDDLNSQWMIFTNSVNALVESLSGGAVKPLAYILGVMTEIVNKAREFVDNPVARSFATIAIAATAAVGAYALYRTAVILTIASTQALITAQGALAGATGLGAAVNALKLVFPAMSAYIGSLTGATAATTGLTFATGASNAALGLSSAAAGAASTAFRALLAAIPVIGWAALATSIAAVPLLSLHNDALLAAGGLDRLNEALYASDQSAAQLFATFTSASGQIAAMEDYAESFGFGITQLALSMSNTGPIEEYNATIAETDAQLAAIVNNGGAKEVSGIIALMGLTAEQVASQLPLVSAALQTFSVAANNVALVDSAQRKFRESSVAFAKAASSSAKATAAVGRSAGGAAKQVRTLADYASDLGGIFSRSFDIRFGSQLAIDSVRASWQSLNDEIADYRTKVLELTADKAVKEYFLSVANAYGDTLRAGVLTAEIAGINDDLADAQAGASTELKGNSKAAIENRKRLTGLISGYQQYIKSLASSGKSQAQIAAAVAKSKAEFIAQATALGYSNSQLKPYIASFNDMAIAVARVPRNITVTANTNPALQALNEFKAKAQKSLGGGFSVPIKVDDSALKKYARGQNILAQIEAARAITANQNEPAQRRIIYADRIKTLSDKYNSGNYWTGGYTGDGGKYEPKGIVHGGEFVFSKQATRTIGVQNLARQHSAAKRGYAGGGPVGSVARAGDGIVELGPRTLRVMREEIGNTILNLGDVQIAQSANRGNRALAGQGVG